MESIAPFFIVFGALAVLVSFVSVLWPLKRIGLPTRKRSALALLLSFSLFLLGGALVSDGPDQSPVQSPQSGRSEGDAPEQSAVAPKQASEAAIHRDADSNPTAKSIGLEFVLIPAGEFRIGREAGPDSIGPSGPRANTVNDLDERPVTQVRISSDFYLARFEVTQGQWETIMGENPSRNASSGPDCPVEQVSWRDTQEFLERLNEAEGMEGRYRLPTEAEWEYAARAGTSGDLYGDLTSIAWYDGNSQGRTQTVGQKKPNAFGLFDMIGNAWEWVHDWKGPYLGGSVTDPTGPRTGERRVARGPGFTCIPKNCRVSSRLDWDPTWRDEALGFRVAQTAE